MFTTGFAIFLSLLFIMAKLKRTLMLRLLHYDVLVDMVVTILVLCLHWGSFEGVMAATIAGLFTSRARHRALRCQQPEGHPRRGLPARRPLPRKAEGGMSKIVNLVQGSAEWLEYRRTMRNASETAAVLGISPWVTPYQLWLLKTGRKEQSVNAAMLNGTALEPEARSAYELETGYVMQPLVMQDGKYSASLDGITLQGDRIVEIKVPMRGAGSSLWQAVEGGEVPGHYGAQIQHQLLVSGASLAHLWLFDGARGLLRIVERDADAMAAIRDAWDGFWRFIETGTPPPLLPADTVQRDDAAWRQAAQAYASAKRATSAADEALERAKTALVALAGHPREEGAGVAVTRFWRAGNVDYKKVLALSGVDLEPYRGKGREEVRVSTASCDGPGSGSQS